MSRRDRTDMDGKVHSRGTIREKNERIVRLKDELNLALQLVVHTRQALESELNTEFAQKAEFIDKTFVTKLKDLTVCYNSLTKSRIDLDKAEKQLDKEMSPAEEREVVRTYIRSLEYNEARQFVMGEVAHLERRQGREAPEPEVDNVFDA